MKELRIKKQRKARRLRRVRRKLLAKATRLRLSVFRSSKHFYAQIIDDLKGKTLLSVSDKEIDVENSLSKVEKAKELGKLFAKGAKEKKIKTVVFDKGAYKYHGRVKSFADGAREGGLNF